MKRILVTAAAIIICFLLQCTVFEALAIAMVSPNLLIILTAASGFMRGSKRGLLTGFFCGLLLDLMSGSTLGFFALIYMLAGYFNGVARKYFYPDDLKFPLIAIGVSDFLINMVIYGAMFLTRGRTAFGYYLFHTIFPELVYTVIIALILYPLILWINQRMERKEKKSAAKFV